VQVATEVTNIPEMAEDRPLVVKDVMSSDIPTVAKPVPKCPERQACVCKLPGLLDDTDTTHSCETFIQQALSIVRREVLTYELQGNPEDLEPRPVKSVRQNGAHGLNGFPDRYAALGRQKKEIQWAALSDGLSSDSASSSNTGDADPTSDQSDDGSSKDASPADGLPRVVCSRYHAPSNDTTTTSRPSRYQNRPKEPITAVRPSGARLKSGQLRFVLISKTLSPASIDVIGCDTCICSENVCVPYKAVSYTWGDSPSKQLIYVDGEERLVTKSLFLFLQHAKLRPRRFSWLWIDALSIDQSDTEERRHQVGTMSTIFRKAYEVIVWLGQGCDDSVLAMRVLSSVVQPSLRSVYARWGTSRQQTIHRAVHSTGEPHVTSSTMDEQYVEWTVDVSKAIVNLCQRPFWKRLWVFQELRHAEDIRLMCGQEIITWSDFRNLWSVVVELRGFQHDISELLNNSLATRMMTLRTKPMDFSLWGLLKETRSLECADEHDRVYALLSVATEGDEDIEADYHASLSSLGHSILRNKYALRRPKALDDVMTDCDFLRDVLRLSWTEMYGYGDSYGDVWAHKVGSPGSSFAGWAEHHRHPAVTKLLLDTV
jgi:hypothetical protein